MKKLTYIILVILTFISLNKVFSQSYYHPESVLYDVNLSRYLISNQGYGNILALDASNQLTIFIDGLTKPRGMYIIDDTLYVADNTYLKAYNLEDGSSLLEFEVPNSQLLNDITTDGEGTLYITDTKTNMVYFYTISNKSIYDFSWGMGTIPNGIIFDNSHLWIVTYNSPGQLIDVDLNNGGITKHTLAGYNLFDGITSDGNGSYYISSWGDMLGSAGLGKILKLDPNNPSIITEFRTGFSGPADIYYNPIKNELAGPNYSGDNVEFIPLATNVFENNSDNTFFDIYQNEMNFEIIIKFKEGFDISLPINVYNLFGQTIENDVITPNQKEYRFNTSYIEAGIYFIRINNNISKLLIIK